MVVDPPEDSPITNWVTKGQLYVGRKDGQRTGLSVRVVCVLAAYESPVRINIWEMMLTSLSLQNGCRGCSKMSTLGAGHPRNGGAIAGRPK